VSSCKNDEYVQRFCSRVPVHVALGVAVTDGMHKLPEERSHVALTQRVLHEIKELAAARVLHDLHAHRKLEGNLGSAC